MSVPAATRCIESVVVDAPSDLVWNLISNFRFNWWDLVDTVQFEGGGSATSVGSIATFHFKDGLTWSVQIVEMSLMNKSITFEVIHSTSPLLFTSAVHTISVTRVTSSNTSFVQWITDFSNDATVEVTMDSSYKRLEAFQNLSVVCSELNALSKRVKDVEARSRSNSSIGESRSRSASVVST
jgi:hypothetical protein